MATLNEKQIKHINTVVAASGKIISSDTDPEDAKKLADDFVSMLEDSVGIVYPEGAHDVIYEHYVPAAVEIATISSGFVSSKDAVPLAVTATGMLASLVSEVAKRFYELGYLATHDEG